MIENIVNNPHIVKLVHNFFHKKLFSSIPTSSPLVIITDDCVKDKVIPPITDFLKSIGYEVNILSFPPGEQNKTWETFISLQNQLVEMNISPGATMIGIGGGIVLDMAGFLASTYCRGMRLFLVPTTITAMIDSSIGGKNGINFRGLKNRLGTIYLPKSVWICPEFLSTLPRHEWHNGIAEAIKHGCIADAYLWEFLENYSETLFSSPPVLNEFIKRNCLIKSAIVAQDLKNRGIRKILNFGHSIGHAIETLSFGYVSHGLSVSVGMVIEMKISLRSGIMKNPQLIDKLSCLLSKFHLPTHLKDLSSLIPEEFQKNVFCPQNIIHTLSYDKKNLIKYCPKIVMLEHLGKVASFNGTYCIAPKIDLLYQILSEECHVMCNN
ncbi:3-dehydroquinate synthase [Chlamydia ibidis]|uniref:3-dehydroquinate synthase n=2 Tax=Chlamydia ibidis TaxID=1405396 RepID=S7J3H1_9CHLA|nr:3-dehydroquinate synthase [Chlamydia ibidis]EPP34577.1 3-dehydroquinate synthase [Chlamydia ibidis]EQM62414.1 3-dehydroquinate synthase [Chlamydia ibidis 10-1398/6]